MSICGLSETVLPMTASARLFGHSTISYTRSLGMKTVHSPNDGEREHSATAPSAFIFDSTVGGSLPIYQHF